MRGAGRSRFLVGISADPLDPAGESEDQPGLPLGEPRPSEEFAPLGKAGLRVVLREKADPEHGLPKRPERRLGFAGGHPGRGRGHERRTGEENLVGHHHGRLGEVQRGLVPGGGDADLALAERALLHGEPAGLVPEDDRRRGLRGQAGDLGTEFARRPVRDAVAAPSAEPRDQLAVADRRKEIGEHLRFFEEVFGLPGHPEGTHRAPFGRSHQSEAGKIHVGGDPGGCSDVLRPPWADQNQVDARHAANIVGVLSVEPPFHNVSGDDSGALVLPLRKWREILFVGAMRPVEGGYVRDPERPLPPLRTSRALPLGRKFRVERLPPVRESTPDPLNPPQRDRSRVRLVPVLD